MKNSILGRLNKLNAVLDKRVPLLEIEYVDGAKEKADWVDVLALTFTEEYDRRPVKAIYYPSRLEVVVEFIGAAIANKETGEDLPYLIEVK